MLRLRAALEQKQQTIAMPITTAAHPASTSAIKRAFELVPILMSFGDSRVAESMWDDAEGGGLFETAKKVTTIC